MRRAGFGVLLSAGFPYWGRPYSVLTFSDARADTVTLTATRDNTRYEQVGGGLSNGAGEHIFVGTTGTSGLRRRALLRFELNGAIPAGSTVNSTTLQLYM